jgi:hypothetical protein
LSIGLSSQRIQDLVSGKTKKVSFEVATAIVNRYKQYNIDWLRNGVGEKLSTSKRNEVVAESIPEYNLSKNKYLPSESKEDYEKALKAGLRLIPEVDFVFSAGKKELIEGDGSNVRGFWYLPNSKDSEVVARMAGTSMLPTFPPGCKMAFKRFGYDVFQPNSIPFGNAFGIIVEDKVTGEWHGHVKVLRRYKDADLSKKFWIAQSLNPDFDDFDIEIAQVRGLFIIKEHIIQDVLL